MLSGLFKAISMAALSLSLILPNISFAGTNSANAQATATLSSSCTITAQNLNFGNLVLPLSAQSASTSMSVLCSKNHAYTIGLAYGGVYGTGSVSLTQYQYYSGNNNLLQVSPWDGSIGGIAQLPSGAIQVTNGETYDGTQIGCPTGSGWSCYVAVGGTTTYNYGKMIGVAKGDNIGYSIQVPGNPGQIWNTGNYSYSSTGTGATQTIPVVGTLVPSQSGSTYPTPDSYMDTVTATVNF